MESKKFTTAYAGRELKMCDFLVIDEFDSRFIQSETAGELYGRILESIIRIRFQNNMPTIMISNDVDPIKSLGTALGASIGSLISGHAKEVFVTGGDYRKSQKGE